ncbi:3-beta-hydroxysteroid-Delta(8),Delta(7)-isomerase-like [Physella acuta]|uniref:3-beta-hydroxysteroid-Delta(8), Delta(7)-isomerase-like n=1 Tax=Physella acuta TaxID=109671 RepID=UPI0027DE6350|nr:3-beta-hydroxysteroid-Delta(8),Delta(7)-isomerase-like [Physella acuta]
MSSESLKVEHPYLPKELKLDHYVKNSKDTIEILATLSGVAAVILVVSWYITGFRTEPFCLKRRLTLCWFMLCGFIHTGLEGYFAIYHKTLAGHSTILGEAWKEYSRSDSRYLSSDTFVVCMETITAVVDGPLAFIAFVAFMTGSNYRYAWQLLLSLFQLYGDVLYFATEFKEGFIHSPTDVPLYFYFYFIFLNSLWIIIPLLLVVDACHHIANCQQVSDFIMISTIEKVKLATSNNHQKMH